MNRKISGIDVEWDEYKNSINKQKHGISFETAALVFADEERIEMKPPGLFQPEWQRILKGRSIMENENIIRTTIEAGQKPTAAQIREIELASTRPVVPDEDAPELTVEQYAEMAEIARARRAGNVKPVVALRINPSTLEKAKATGKGYTGFLSRLLDNAIKDPQLVAKSL